MIIKEFCPTQKTAVIREDCYGSRLSKFLKLFEIAKSDLPGLSPDNVEIIRYGGARYAKTFGIEFVCSSILPGYEIIEQLEYI